jgi:hypothetical protein
MFIGLGNHSNKVVGGGGKKYTFYGNLLFAYAFWRSIQAKKYIYKRKSGILHNNFYADVG